MMLDARVGGEVERLLEACVPAPFVDECAQIARLSEAAHKSAEFDTSGGSARARALIEQIDDDHSTPVLVWNAGRRTVLRRAIDAELAPILSRLRKTAAASDKGIGAVRPGDVRWKPAALSRRLATDGEADLCVGGLHIRPFIAADGFFNFGAPEDAAAFLVALLESLRNESRFLLERKATHDQQSLGDLWHALHLLLSTNAPLQTHKACLTSTGFFFGATRLPTERDVLTRVCEVLQTLVRAGGDGALFANLVSGPHLLWLLSLCRSAPPLATLALSIVADVVRRASRSVPHLLNSGGLLLLLDCVFRLRPTEGAAVGAAEGAADDSAGSAAAARAALAERLGAVRVLAHLVSDSRHGAEIAECVCAMLTPRFRYALEDTPDRFIELFDAVHTSGSAEKGNVREWDDVKRDELGGLLRTEVRRLLDAASAEEPEVVPPAAADASKRQSYVPPPPPSSAWLEASSRVEAAWRVEVEL